MKLDSTKPKHVKSALLSLPLGLNATCERMLLRIGDQLQEDALTLLRWLAYALLTDIAKLSCFLRPKREAFSNPKSKHCLPPYLFSGLS